MRAHGPLVASRQLPPGAPLAALPAVFANLSDGPLLARLWLYRANARPGHPLRALWRAYVASFVLNLGSTNDLIRRLDTDAGLRRLCGFGRTLLHRTTFNRFIARLSRHPDLVETAFARVTTTGSLSVDLVPQAQLSLLSQ